MDIQLADGVEVPEEELGAFEGVFAAITHSPAIPQRACAEGSGLYVHVPARIDGVESDATESYLLPAVFCDAKPGPHCLMFSLELHVRKDLVRDVQVTMNHPQTAVLVTAYASLPGREGRPLRLATPFRPSDAAPAPVLFTPRSLSLNAEEVDLVHETLAQLGGLLAAGSETLSSWDSILGLLTPADGGTETTPTITRLARWEDEQYGVPGLSLAAERDGGPRVDFDVRVCDQDGPAYFEVVETLQS